MVDKAKDWLVGTNADVGALEMEAREAFEKWEMYGTVIDCDCYEGFGVWGSKKRSSELGMKITFE